MEATTSAAIYDQISLPVLSLQIVAVVLAVLLPAAAWVGLFIGRRNRNRLLAQGKEVDMRAGETSVGAILAMLGLLLAFSFGNSLSYAQLAKTSLIDEAAALGTVFARADYLPEPGRTELKEAILDYTKTRLLPGNGSIDSLEAWQAFLETSLSAQGKLWPLTVEHTGGSVPAPIKTFFASAMNDALDAHLSRTRVLSQPVSTLAQIMVLGAALAALFLMGDRAGLMGRMLTWRTFVFSGFLFVVMITIADTERGTQGFVRLDDTSLRATIFEMEMALGGTAADG